ncbi:hypothetical protein Tco_1381992, partial [Tanacetum coccineum]
MSNLKFAETHNLVAFLEKPKESDGFEGIIDFLNASSIRYVLTVNPTIYTSCIKQFWATAKAKTVNGEVHIQALVDGKQVIITETKLERIGYENLTQKLTFYKAFSSPQWKFLIHTILQCLSAKTTAWNAFSSTMASREGKGLSGRVTPLFQTMMVQAPEELGEGSEIPTDPQHTPTINQPSSSQPPKKQKPKKTKKQNTKVSQPSDLTQHMADETEDVESVPIPSNDPLLIEIAKLKEKVKKLKRRSKSRTLGLKRLRKVGRTARIESSKDKVFDEQEVEIEKVVSIAEVTIVSATTTITVDELNMAQTLIKIKAAKSKAVTAATTTTTTAVTRPKARGVVVQEPSEFR